MKIGTIREIKKHEYRVGLTPEAAGAYVKNGHQVFLEKDAGLGAGFTDEEYIKFGVEILSTPAEIFENCEMIIKVKEPLREEYELIRENQIVYTYFHLSASEELTIAMLKQGGKCVAYETIEDNDHGLPCLKPMSEIAGRLSVQEGAKYLEKPFGGSGVLLSGVPGTTKGKVLVIGGGIVGANACKIAVGMGADVTVMDLNLNRLTYLDDLYNGKITTLYSTDAAVEDSLAEADLVIGAVLIPGAKAPKVIKKDYLKNMKTGSVIVDVAVDQGGCSETTNVTYHDDPVFNVDGVVNYCVGNMPGAVPRTSTIALNNTTLSYGLRIANNGLEKACKDDLSILKGVNIYRGNCTYENVAKVFNLNYVPVESLI